MEELLDINKMMYDIPTNPSVVANATLNTFNFNPNNYDNSIGGEIMQLEFNEGLNFVDGTESYIRLKLRVNNVLPYFSFSQNARSYYSCSSGASIVNLIKIVELVTKDGNVLFKEDYKNHTQCIREYKINEARKSYLGVMGCIDQNSSYKMGLVYQNYQQNPTPTPEELRFGAYPIFPTNKEVTFLIPLSEISSFFNTASLIHPKILEKSILRLTLDRPEAGIRFLNSNLQDTNGSNITVNISNIAAVLSEKELYQEVKEKINHQLKTKGLSYAYYQSYNTYFDVPNEGIYNNASFVFPINLSAAKIKYLCVKPIQKISLTTAQTSSGYPMSSIRSWETFSQQLPENDINSAQFSCRVRLGTKVYPENYEISTIPDFYDITTYTLNNISYSSCQDVDCCKNINKLAPSCVGSDLYRYYNQFNLTSGGLIWAFNFERSQGISNSGLSTNQERLLTFEINNYKQQQVLAEQNGLICSVQFLTVVTIFENGEIAVQK